MDTQIKELEKLIQEHVQTEIDLNEKKRNLEEDHARKLRELKRREDKIKEMENIPAMLKEAKRLKKEAREARQDLKREQRKLKKLTEEFEAKEKDMNEKRRLLVKGQEDIDRIKKQYLALLEELNLKVNESDLPSPSVVESSILQLQRELSESTAARTHKRRRLQVLERLIRAQPPSQNRVNMLSPLSY